MDRRKFLKWVLAGSAIVAVPMKMIASVAWEVKRPNSTRKIKKPRVLSENEQFEFLAHFDKKLKEPAIQNDEDSLTSCSCTFEELRKIYADESIKPLKVGIAHS